MSKNRLFVGFGHRARNGKSEAALAIHRHFWNDRTVVIPFALAIKEWCRQHHGMAEKNGDLLQRVGTACRAGDPDRWIRELQRRIPPHARVVLIPDVRRRNEFDWIRGMGGALIRVTRTNPDGTTFVSQDRDQYHVTETELENADWDYEIAAPSGDSAELARQARSVYKQVKGRMFARPAPQSAGYPVMASGD